MLIHQNEAPGEMHITISEQEKCPQLRLDLCKQVHSCVSKDMYDRSNPVDAKLHSLLDRFVNLMAEEGKKH